MTRKDVEEFLSESNHIEGVYDETSFFNAQQAWKYLILRGKMDMHTILGIHGILMGNRESWSDPRLLISGYAGKFRDGDVYVGDRKCMRPEFVKAALKDWCISMNRIAIGVDADKERLSKLLHVEYETIHPFFDGNGRTGRMFMNWYRLRNQLPILVIHEGSEQVEYYKWFRMLP